MQTSSFDSSGCRIEPIIAVQCMEPVNNAQYRNGSSPPLLIQASSTL